jgi:glycosyltransferase involved in cell wall biosynthesis
MFSLQKHADHGINRDRLLHIPNFVNSSIYEPQYENGRYALFVGRISREKGMFTLLAAVEHLDIQVRIVGDGPLKAEYEDMAQSMSHVIFEGYKTGDDLKRLYEDAAFLVLPSECYENAPMTVLEAYAYGKPAIGSRIGGIAEMIDHGKTGMLFEMGNVHQLAECIGNLWKDKSLRQQMGRAAREKVERKYSAEAHYEQLMKIYRNMLN